VTGDDAGDARGSLAGLGIGDEGSGVTEQRAVRPGPVGRGRIGGAKDVRQQAGG
jgi:hypothetical protein